MASFEARYPMVRVEWEDSARLARWRSLTEVKKETPCLIMTVGCLMRDDAVCVTVVGTAGMDEDPEVDGGFVIPRSAVRKVDYLEVTPVPLSASAKLWVKEEEAATMRGVPVQEPPGEQAVPAPAPENQGFLYDSLTATRQRITSVNKGSPSDAAETTISHHGTVDLAPPPVEPEPGRVESSKRGFFSFLPWAG